MSSNPAQMERSSMTWPFWWRIWILVNISIYTTMGNYFAGCISPLLVVFARQFQVTIDQSSHLTTYTVLVIGLSNIMGVAISQYIGKRYTILISMLIFLAVNVWTIYITDYNTLLASRIVGGLAAGIVEALGPQIIEQCFPERQLASAMAIYTLALGAGASVGPMIAGIVFDGTGNWTWIFTIAACIIGVNFISSVLMLPETTNGSPVEQERRQQHEAASTDSAHEADKSDSEKVVQVEADAVAATTTATATADAAEISLLQLWRRRSFFLTLPDIKPEANFFFLIFSPFQLLLAPAVAILIISMGVMIAYTIITSIVVSSILQSPPILWSTRSVGLLNLSLVIGLIVGIPAGGPLADILSRRSARRHNGVHVRESRLPAVLPGAIVTPIGAVILGVSLQQDLGWVGIAFGWTMISIGLTAVVNVQLTYCVDCYTWRAGHVGVILNVAKNLIGFGVSYGAVPWLMAVGPEKQYGTMAGILWGLFLLNIPLYFYGPVWRQWSMKFIS